MKKSTLVILLILVVVAITVALFTHFYQAQIDKIISLYIDKITTCANITNEDECFAKSSCEGIYGSSCPTCNDLQFQRCREVSEKTVVQLQQDRQLCESTGGEWYRNKLGNFCLCEAAGANKVFNHNQGCIAR